MVDKEATIKSEPGQKCAALSLLSPVASGKERSNLGLKRKWTAVSSTYSTQDHSNCSWQHEFVLHHPSYFVMSPVPLTYMPQHHHHHPIIYPPQGYYGNFGCYK